MGIPSCRFVDQVHEEFTCAVCLDVAVDPAVANDCAHIFCFNCIIGTELTKCPTCLEPIENPKWIGLEGLNQRVYLAMGVKCLNPSCKEQLNVETYLDHDNKCPITFKFCSDCGYKNRRGSSNVHSCSQQVRLDQLENQLAEERRRSKQQQVQMEKALAAERKRTRDLIMLCVSFRKEFCDWDCGPRSVEWLVTFPKEVDTGNNSVAAMKKILEQYNKLEYDS